MIKKRRLFINALASVIQVIVNGGAFFVLYRFLYDTLGVADVGVWATVLTTTSVSHLANLGLTGSTLIYVARYRAQEQPERVQAVVETSVVSIAVFMGTALALTFPLLERIVPWIINDAAKIPVALAVLPYALLSFWCTSVATVVLSALEGFERIDVRQGLTMLSALVYLGLCVLLVPHHGLLGLAYAQVAQAALLLLAGWVALKWTFRPLPLLPLRWSRPVFGEMLHYNLQFQAMSLTQMLFEPTTRALMARLGGLEAAGFFEMAHKMVLQLRALIITAHQAILPAIAGLRETAPEMLREVYRVSFRLVLFLVAAALPFLIAATPVVSELYLGAYQPTFMLYTTLLLVGWFLNILGAPAYFAYMGTGALRWNVLGHLITAVLNLALGVVLGLAFGGVGIVVAFVTALLVGSAATARAYEREQGFRLAELWQRDSFLLGLAALGGMGLLLSLYFWVLHPWPALVLVPLFAALYLTIVAWPMWRHDMRRQLVRWLRAGLGARAGRRVDPSASSLPKR